MRRIAYLSAVSVLLCGALVAVAGAQDDTDDGPQPHPATEPPPETPEREYSPEDLARRAKVVARVGETEITIGEVEDSINEQSPFVRVRYRDPEQLREHVQSMLRFELMARAAERADFDEDEMVVHTTKQNAVQYLIRHDFDDRITVDSSMPAGRRARPTTTAHPDEFSSAGDAPRGAHPRGAAARRPSASSREARDADTRTLPRSSRASNSTDPEPRKPPRRRPPLLRRGGPPAQRVATRTIDEGLATRRLRPRGGRRRGRASRWQMGDEWSVVKLTGRRPAEAPERSSRPTPTIRLRHLALRNRQQARSRTSSPASAGTRVST